MPNLRMWRGNLRLWLRVGAARQSPLPLTWREEALISFLEGTLSTWLGTHTRTHSHACMHAAVWLPACTTVVLPRSALLCFSNCHCFSTLLGLSFFFRLLLPFSLVGLFIAFHVVSAFQPCWAFHCLSSCDCLPALLGLSVP